MTRSVFPESEGGEADGGAEILVVSRLGQQGRVVSEELFGASVLVLSVVLVSKPNRVARHLVGRIPAVHVEGISRPRFLVARALLVRHLVVHHHEQGPEQVAERKTMVLPGPHVFARLRPGPLVLKAKPN